MPNENETEASGKDALNAYESLFGGEEPGANDVVTKEQDAKTETGQDKRGSQVADDRGGADESGPAEEQTDDDKTSPTEDLKVVLAIKDGRATIGVQGAVFGPAHRVVRWPGPIRASAGSPGGDRKGEGQVGGRTQVSRTRATHTLYQGSL